MHVSLLAALVLAVPHETIVDRLIQPCQSYFGHTNPIAVTERLDDPTTLVMRYMDRGLFESHDGGLSWVPLTPPHMCMSPVDTFFNPQPKTGLPWCLGTLGENRHSIIFCSADRGETFARLPYQPPNELSSINNFLVDPRNPRKMVLHVSQAFGDDILLRSNDGGADWQSWKFPGVKNEKVELHQFLGDGSLLATVVSGPRGKRGRARVVRYTPGKHANILDVAGPWDKQDLPFIQVDSARPEHWYVTTFKRSGESHAYESFDGGESFTRLSDDLGGYGQVAFLADGGLATLPRTQDEGIIAVRHGKVGAFTRIKLPDWGDGLYAAGNTLFFAYARDIYRLDESAGTSNAAWRRFDLEVLP